MSDIPTLCETDGIQFSEKIIHQHYYLPFHDGYYWLIAELDQVEQLGFGYACLNDPQLAEWGYIHLQELRDVATVFRVKPLRVEETKEYHV